MAHVPQANRATILQAPTFAKIVTEQRAGYRQHTITQVSLADASTATMALLLRVNRLIIFPAIMFVKIVIQQMAGHLQSDTHDTTDDASIY